MSHSSRACQLFAAALVLALLAIQSVAQVSNPVSPASPVSRIVAPIVDADSVTLEGNIHPLARPEFDRGTVSEGTRMERMVLVLRADPEQEKALDRLTEAQQQPGNVLYHHWLAPEEFGDRFGVSLADIAQITGWLTGHGFAVEPISAGRRLLLFSGTAGQVAEAFHTEIHQFEVGEAMHIANSEDPQIPASLAPVVAGVLSLHDFRRISASRGRQALSRPDNTQGGTHYIFPADFATIYDLNPQYANGRNGSGSSIAIVGRSNINLSDVASFRSYAGLNANQPTILLDGANPGLVSGDQDESTLDVEWSGGVAPGAAVIFVVAASTATSDGVDLSAQYIVNHKTANAMSTSYGSCEQDMGSGELSFYNSLWQQAASEGISSFVSSGDSGVAGCDGGSSPTGSVAGVNGLCSSPYSTCVGGTEFNEGSGNDWSATNGSGGGSAISYIPEKVWNESSSVGGSGLWSSGGGASLVYPQPTWQEGVAGANHNGMRLVPDVAVTAASHDGYLICENGNWWVIAGTSAASPSFAGIMSIVDEKQGGVGQGNANPHLYAMLGVSQNPFHSTPSGNNSVPGVNGFTASGAAYNLATGLGSVDANLLVNGWSGSNAPTQAFSLTPSVVSETLLPGKSVTFTVAVTGIGGFSGSAALSATLPSGVTLTFSPATVKAGASATGTLSVAANTPAGTISIPIAGSSGSFSASTSISLTIQRAPTLSLTTSTATVAVVRGNAATQQVTTATGGTFSGTVTLGVTGLPAGVTSTWSSGSFSVSGSSNTTSTLTLKATSTAALTTSQISITASGDGLKAQTSSILKVNPTPSVTLSVSTTQLNMKSNATQSVTVTITPVGSAVLAASSTAASFQIAGLPAGITATWSKPVLTASGALQSTLTLAGSKSAIASSSKPTIQVKATDVVSSVVYSATGQISLVVTLANTTPPKPVWKK
jgi:subtilase family serine protease